MEILAQRQLKNLMAKPKKPEIVEKRPELKFKETLHIYYGSMTGRAMLYTQQLQEEAEERGYKTEMTNLSEFDPN